jgi:hypothetical protein
MACDEACKDGWIGIDPLTATPCPSCNPEGTASLPIKDIESATQRGREEADKIRRTGTWGSGATLSDTRFR